MGCNVWNSSPRSRKSWPLLHAGRTCSDGVQPRHSSTLFLMRSFSLYLQTVELWTRRNFRCDCGSQKFGNEARCQLFPNKDPVNERNRYNQNYGGVYCTCHKPYPDPERDDEYDMDMCIVCEDWFHGEHLGLPDSLQVRLCSALHVPRHSGMLSQTL